MSLIDLLLGPSLIWMQKIFLGLIFVYIGFQQSRKRDDRPTLVPTYRRLVWVSVSFLILFAIGLSFGQYYIWEQNELTRYLNQNGLDRETFQPILKIAYPLFAGEHGYFLFYALTRFWQPLVLTMLSAGIFYWFLKLLGRYRENFFEPYEFKLALLLVLLVGWPNFLVFLALTFLIAVMVAAIRLKFPEKLPVQLTWPMLISAGITQAAGFKLEHWLRLLN